MDWAAGWGPTATSVAALVVAFLAFYFGARPRYSFWVTAGIEFPSLLKAVSVRIVGINDGNRACVLEHVRVVYRYSDGVSEGRTAHTQLLHAPFPLVAQPGQAESERFKFELPDFDSLDPKLKPGLRIDVAFRVSVLAAGARWEKDCPGLFLEMGDPPSRGWQIAPGLVRVVPWFPIRVWTRVYRRLRVPTIRLYHRLLRRS